ncbi:surface lipoprotein assembly modifier [Kangiella marina]|uniref:Surface lipoprotein assembly modifier C-terminal domain-containing protein n=1 Tax=Kangiella marina TaxID=1079178 RepID=A0ABP8IJJ2_9GAMM
MKYVLTPICLFCFSSSVIANTESDYGVTLEAGATHNSELVVEEIDQRSANGDLGRYLSLDLNGELTFQESFSVKAGYNISDTDYQDTDDFDLTIQRLYGDASYEFSGFTVGVNQHQILADLAGQEFLDMDRSGIYLSKLLNNRIFIRSEYTTTNKEFDDLPDRNASNDALGIDTYFFYNQAKAFFSVGYTSEDEQANASELSYDGDVYRATVSSKFGDNDAHKLQLKWRYYNRDYQGLLPELNTPRNDERHAVTFSWDYYFTPEFALATQLQRTTSDSNVESADYTANEIELLLRLEL